jgi:hypothetical protein
MRGALAAAAATAALVPARGEGHPLHTTLARLAHDAGRGEVRVTVRVFTDDLGAAAAPAEALAYTSARFAVAGADGRRIVLAGCGVRRREDATLVCLRGRAPAGLAGARVRNAMLFERFTDQVNVVQAEYGGRSQALLFTRGDGAKRLP